jgi:hypothetical protein
MLITFIQQIWVINQKSNFRKQVCKPSALEAGVTGRASSTSYHLNMKQSAKYSAGNRRVLVLTGYYS